MRTYHGQALPYYGRLIVADPAVSGSEEGDLGRCVADSEQAIIGGSRWRVAVKAGQDTVAIAINLELWDTAPDTEVDGDWQRCRELTVQFPDGRLGVENISAGPIPLSPGDVEGVTLPGGAGAYHVTAWHRGRDRAAAAVQQLGDADEAEKDIESEYARLAGLEEYLLRIWPA
ncbi:hypothetical protein [Actinoplanes teichomyceticus]|uniref:Uncharacterized protein n=1 Tax=Actinoplanes teichomyceticus TaxID=1867 RepID=A0A561VMY5_ACTTI|nr:hypothetical protein [Actinoplanes teichomyceticus]TWG12960.1 hypothetical protein FHX34_105828 [Actinoplanes teichomyceticus]GIF16972.1 hypothetical protein Ate01nite_70040 [Actinoplanes teichomyceticus]